MSTAGALRFALLIADRGELAKLKPHAEALLAAGHSVHFAIRRLGDGDGGPIQRLRRRHPLASFGYALPRAMHDRSFPAVDPGILTYLRQLDLDVLLMVEPPGPRDEVEDYAAAARLLRIPFARLAAGSEPGAGSADDPAEPVWRLRTTSPDELLRRARRLVEAPPAARRTPAPRPLEGRATMAPGPISIGPSLHGFRLALRSARALAPAGSVLRGYVGPAIKAAASHDVLAADAALALAAKGDGPILVGPWFGDLGIEMLYWLPFVRWWRKRYKVDKSRLVSISRGALGRWYETVAGGYLDMAALWPEADLLRLDRRRIEEAARYDGPPGLTPTEAWVCEAAAASLSLGAFNVLPPWTLAALFDPYWEGAVGYQAVAPWTRVGLLSLKHKRVRQICPHLPSTYVAVSFPFGDAFPDEEANRKRATETVAGLAKRGNVVVIDSDIPFAPHPKVRHLDAPGSDRREAQFAAIAGAEAFVGSLGPLAYVAGLFGKRCIAFESAHSAASDCHKDFASRQLAPLGVRMSFVSAEEGLDFGPPLARRPIALAAEERSFAPASAQIDPPLAHLWRAGAQAGGM